MPVFLPLISAQVCCPFSFPKFPSTLLVPDWVLDLRWGEGGVDRGVFICLLCNYEDSPLVPTTLKIGFLSERGCYFDIDLLYLLGSLTAGDLDRGEAGLLKEACEICLYCIVCTGYVEIVPKYA